MVASASFCITGSDDRGLRVGYDCDWQVDVGEGDVCDAGIIKVFSVPMVGDGAFANERFADYGL